MSIQNLIDGIDKTIAQLQADRARLVQKQAEVTASQGYANPYKRFAFKMHTKQCPLGPDHETCGFKDAQAFGDVDWSLEGPAEYLRQAAEFVQLVQAGGGTVSL